MASNDCEEDLDELRAAALASLMLANAQKKAPQANSAATWDARAQQQRHDGFRPRVERGLLSDVSTNHGAAAGSTRTSGFPLPVAAQTRPRPDVHGNRSHYHPPPPAGIAASSRRHNQPGRQWTAPCNTRGQYVWRKSTPPQRSRDDDIIFGKTNLIILSELPPQDDVDGEEATLRLASKSGSEAAATAAVAPTRLLPLQPAAISIAGTSGEPIDLQPFRADRDYGRGGPTSSRYGSSSMHHWRQASGSRPAASGSGNGGRGHRASTSAAAASATSTKVKSSVPRRFRRLEEDSDSDESDSDDAVDEDRSRHDSLSPTKSASDDEDKPSAVSGAAAEPVSSTSRSAGGDAGPAASGSIEAAAAVPARALLLQPDSRQIASVGADSTSSFAAAAASTRNSATAAADLRAAARCGAAAAPKPEAAAPAAAVVLPADRRPESNLSASAVVSGAASSGGRVPRVQQQPREASRSSDKSDVARPSERKQPLEIATGAPTSASAAAAASSKNSGTVAALAAPATSSRVASELPPTSDDISSVTSAAARNAVDELRLGRSKGSVAHGASDAATAVALVNSLGQSAGPHQRASAARSSSDRVCPVVPGLSSESSSDVRTESGRTLQPQHVGSTCRSDSVGIRRRGDDAGKNRSDSVGSRRRGDDAGKQSNENRVVAAAATAACIAGLSGSGSSSLSLGQQQPPEKNGGSRSRPAAAQRRPLAERLGKRSDNSKPPDSATSAASGAAVAPITTDTAATVATAVAAAAVPNAVQKIPGAPVGVGSCAVVGGARQYSDVAIRPCAAAVGDADALLSCSPPSAVSTVGAASGSTSGRTPVSIADRQRQQLQSSLVRASRIAAPARTSDAGEQHAAAAAYARHAGCLSDSIAATRATPAVDDPSRRDRSADAAHQCAAAVPGAANPASRSSRTDGDRHVAAFSAGTSAASGSCDRVAGSASERSQEQQRKLEARRLKFGVAGTAQPQPSSTSRSSSPATSCGQQRHQEPSGQQTKLVSPPIPTTAASVALEVPASLRSDATCRASASAAAAMAAANAALTKAVAVASTSPGTKRRSERGSSESEPPVKRSPLAASGIDVRSMQPPDFAATVKLSSAQLCLPEPPLSESNRRCGDDRHVVVVGASEQQSISTRPDRSRHLSTAIHETSSSSSSSSSLQGDLVASGSSRSKASALARLGHRVVNVVRHQSLPTETTSSNVSPEVAVLLPEEGIVGSRLNARKRSHLPLADVVAEEARKGAHSAVPDASVDDSVVCGSTKRIKQSAAERLERCVRMDASLQHVETGHSSGGGGKLKRPSQPLEDRQPEPMLKLSVQSELMPKLSEQPQQSPLLASRLEEQQQLRSSRNSPPASSDQRPRQAEQLDSVAQQPQQQLRRVQLDRSHGDGRKPSMSRRRSSGGSNSSKISSSSSSRHASLLQRALQPGRRHSEDDGMQPLASDVAGHSRVALDVSDKRAAEAQLDERIRKIKEKNAAILQRHQMIEAEKQWTSGC